MIFQTEFVSDVASDFLKQMIILKSFDSVLNMYPSLSVLVFKSELKKMSASCNLVCVIEAIDEERFVKWVREFIKTIY